MGHFFPLAYSWRQRKYSNHYQHTIGFGSAIGFKKAGFKNVDLYESASKLSDVGAGINVGRSPHQSLVFRSLRTVYGALAKLILFSTGTMQVQTSTAYSKDGE